MTNSTKPVIFHNDDLNISLHGLNYQGKPVFFAVEVAKALGYADPHQAIEYNCKSLIKLNSVQCTESGLGFKPKGIILLTEPDLYRLILRSQLPSAERVQGWVCEEVLPSIRKTGSYTTTKSITPDNGLQQFRKARALKMATEAANDILNMLPELSGNSRQCVIAGLVNPVAGSEVIPLPVLTEKLLSATEIGEVLGVSANRVGKIANANNLKTPENGEFVMDKSRYSNKQVSTFRYNVAGVEKIRALLTAESTVLISA
ncbi:TPA: phage repressor protein [Salmonella enterica subsp. enterica serovar Kodjovi]|nr:phage repressor protein [Salmonella enterica subsp. enterica serovar Kodjovi]